MRHAKNNVKLNRTCSHRRCLIANMLKNLIDHERIITTLAKAKALRSRADKMITIAKKNTLAARREAQGQLMIRYNTLTSKEAKAVKAGDKSAYNADRTVVKKLFDVLGPRFANRNGGYTRIVKTSDCRHGDSTAKCMIEFLKD